ncbi:YciI family protein [Caenimonas terrae]|uniref:YciI family protein n=1 Tax=Caenimonas terrae TaxID=696074 RepID=A0ABW0ND79_9BURK
MSYMLLIVEDPAQRGTRTKAQGEAVYQRMVDFSRELESEGVLLGVESLTSQRDAARVKVRGGKAQVLDGPFAEAKEMIGGFYLLNCDSREQAVAIAGRCPASEWATVEVRAVGPCFM